jgi:hypothetical protein
MVAMVESFTRSAARPSNARKSGFGQGTGRWFAALCSASADHSAGEKNGRKKYAGSL